jgi:photosystem II stability/assembly factor-like uncharacterized protein
LTRRCCRQRRKYTVNRTRLVTIVNRPRLVIFSIAVLAIIFGYLVTRASTPANDKPSTSVFRELLFTPHDEFYAIHLTQHGAGWVVGKFGKILHTSDSGKSWTEQNSRTGKSLTSVSFTDGIHGFAVGGGGIILTTADGGQSWQKRESGTKDHLLEVKALSATRAFVAGAFGTLLSISDGGANWTKHSLPWNRLVPRLIRDSGQVEPNLNTVFSLDEKEGWLGGEFGLLLHTRDGGRSWIAIRSGADFPQITSIRFRDRRTGWAVGARGTVLNTNDGGQTWREIDTGTKKDLYGVWIDGQQGLIVGQGTVLQTNSGGLEWRRLEPSINTPWLSGVAGNAEAAVVVGHAGIIRRISFTALDRQSSQRKASTP